MKKFVVILSLCLCFDAALLRSRVAAAQILTAEEVTAVMESPAVRDGFEKCAAAYPHPENINMVFIVEADGSVSLAGTDPAVEANLLVCLQTAAGNVKLKATGKKFEITYPMQLPAYVPPPVQPQPAQRTLGVVVVPPPTAPPQPVPAAAAPKPTPDPYWRSRYAKARGMQIAGAVLVPVGGVMLIASSVWILSYGVSCTLVESISSEETCDIPGILPIIWIASFPIIATGVVLLVIGSIRKRRAAHMMYSAFVPHPVISPMPDGEGAVGVLRWYF